MNLSSDCVKLVHYIETINALGKLSHEKGISFEQTNMRSSLLFLCFHTDYLKWNLIHLQVVDICGG